MPGLARDMETIMRLLSADEASVYLGIPKATLAKMRWAGKGCRFVKLGRKVYYRPTDLEDWIAANERASTSDSGQQHSPSNARDLSHGQR